MHKRILPLVVLISSVLGMLAYSGIAAAGGFYLRELGTPVSLGTGGAAMTTNTFTPDAAFTNPAGMTWIPEKSKGLMTGFMVLAPFAEFDLDQADAGGGDGGNAGSTAFIPSFFYTAPINDRWDWGISFAAAQGGGLDFGDDWAGRYSAIEAGLTGIGLSPSVSYRVNDRFSLGGGVSIIYTRFDMEIGINQSAVMAPDGKAKLEELDDVGLQPFLGAIYKVSDKLTLGAVYRAEMDVEVDGDLKFQNLVIPVQPDGSVKADWDNPQLFEVGLHYRINERWEFVANANWEEWSAFSNNTFTIDTTGPIDVITTGIDRNWDDTWHIGLGMGRFFGDGQILSFGVSYDSSVVSNSDRTIDLPLDRQAKISASYGPFKGSLFDVTFGATITDFGDAKVTQTSQGVTFSGDFDTNIGFFLGFAGHWHSRNRN